MSASSTAPNPNQPSLQDRVRNFINAPFYKSEKVEYSQGEFLLTLLGGIEASHAQIQNGVLDGIQSLYNAMQEINKGTGDFSRNLHIIAASPLTLEAAQQALEEIHPQSDQQRMSKEFLLKGLGHFCTNLYRAFPDILQSPSLWRDRVAQASEQTELPQKSDLAHNMRILLASCVVENDAVHVSIDRFLDIQAESVAMAKKIRMDMAQTGNAPATTPTDAELQSAAQGLISLAKAMRNIAGGMQDKEISPSVINRDLTVLRKWPQILDTYKKTMSRFWNAHEALFRNGEGTACKEQLKKVVDRFAADMETVMAPMQQSMYVHCGRA